MHVSSLKDPAKEYPKSMFLAVGLVLLIPALFLKFRKPDWRTADAAPDTAPTEGGQA